MVLSILHGIRFLPNDNFGLSTVQGYLPFETFHTNLFGPFRWTVRFSNFLNPFTLALYRATEDIVDKSVYRTNLVYGDLSPELSHVISIHGTVDPWHALGLTEDLAEDVVTIVVNGWF